MPYSPWMDAAGDVQNMGNRISGVANNLTQLRYNQSVRQQQLALEAAKAREAIAMRGRQLELTDRLNRAHEGLYGEQAALAAERKQQLITLAQIAKQAGEAQHRLRLSKAPSTRYEVSAHTPSVLEMTMPPIYGAEDLATADLESALTESAALRPQAAASMMQPRNVGANQVAYRPYNGEEVARGPMVLGQGAMAQYPGQGPVVNPRQPGAVDPGQLVGPLLQAIHRAETPVPGSDIEDDPKLRTPGRFTPQYTNMVQLVDQLMAQIKMGTNAPSAPTVAAKVMTPDIAAQYLKKHGNRPAAEAAAKQDGYSW